MPDGGRPCALGRRALSRAAAERLGAGGARRIGAVPRPRPGTRGRRPVRVGGGRPARSPRPRRRRDASAPRPAPRRAPRAHRDAGGRVMTPTQILIAEDETLIRLDLRALLESSGFEVCAEARDGLEAVEPRKAIERAKGILMAKDGLTEAEAFERLRRASQRSGRPMRVIADAVAATLG